MIKGADLVRQLFCCPHEVGSGDEGGAAGNGHVVHAGVGGASPLILDDVVDDAFALKIAQAGCRTVVAQFADRDEFCQSWVPRGTQPSTYSAPTMARA